MNFFSRAPLHTLAGVQVENNNRPINWFILFALVGATAITFLPVIQFESTNYDDPNYVFENPAVLQGLTAESVKWAFTTGHAANWHPLTWISHMADVEIFGTNAGGHHVVNVLLHCANVALVFTLLCKLTNTLWRSAFVAALFGLHPLHVESVAWIAERKDVLSTFFGLLALLAYAQFAAQRPLGSSKFKSWYGATLALFALSLLCKPMLVTLPLILLLFDFWPLKRFAWSTLRPLLIEKIPFLVLTVISSGITLIVQSRGGAVRSLEHFALPERLANAAIACALYLNKTFWPAELAAFYPIPDAIPGWSVVAAAVLLTGCSVFALASARKRPYRLIGWLWLVVTLAPVVGIVQVGMQQMADRYTYLPLIGIFVWVAWDAVLIVEKVPATKTVFAVIAVTIIGGSAVVARRQVLVWRDSESLFRHALAVTEKNYLAHNNLGYHLFSHGRIPEALSEYEKAIRINPTYTDAHSNLGRALATQERYAEAAEHFEAVLQILPQDVIANNNLGNTLALLGRHEEAIEQFRRALAVKPRHAAAHNNWAISAEELGHSTDAIEHYRAALEIDPNFTAALNNLAWILATHPDAKLRNGVEAVQLAERACRLTGYDQPLALLTLAAASAEAGKMTEAVPLATRAHDLAAMRGDDSLTKRADAMLRQFNAGNPYRTGNSTPE